MLFLSGPLDRIYFPWPSRLGPRDQVSSSLGGHGPGSLATRFAFWQLAEGHVVFGLVLWPERVVLEHQPANFMFFCVRSFPSEIIAAKTEACFGILERGGLV